MALFTKVSKNSDDEAPQVNINRNPEIEEEEPEQLETAPALKDNDWLDKESSEGQLSVDVFQTKDNIIIKSTIAGVKPEDIDISIDNDMVTVRGSRQQEESVKEEDFFYQECYWGDFSRSVILPVEVVAENAEAMLKNGVLTLILPKARKVKSVAVKVKTE